MKQYRLIDKLLAILGEIIPIRGRWLVVSSITLAVMIIGIGSYFIKQNNFIEQESPKVVQASQINKPLINKPVQIKQNANIQNISDEELLVYNKMHKMVNTKIEAVDGKIWGETEITDDRCNELITEVTRSGYSDKDILLQFLTRWKAKNFSSCVEEHNYLWDGLGGTIGKASAIRP